MQNRKNHIEKVVLRNQAISKEKISVHSGGHDEISRRSFIGSTVFFAGTIVLGARFLSNKQFGYRASFLRPPGAVAESLFVKKCIGCAKCLESCLNNCIQLLDADQGFSKFRTPVIVPRTKGCMLCMRCTMICPTGALLRINPEGSISRKTVSMGLARLNKSVCFSYNGRTCGVCYRACPLPGKAMTIGLYEQPTVHKDACVGCGLCEQACIHLPQAIRVVDKGRFS